MTDPIFQNEFDMLAPKKNISDFSGYALPKSETHWLEGMPLKNSSDRDLRQDIEKFKRELEKISDPNCGRIGELKEKIRKKTLITAEAIEETAHRLAEIFLGKKPPF